MLSYSVDLKAPLNLWNLLSKAVPGKFHGSCRHRKCNCLQHQAHVYKSLAWQIVLIFNTVESSHCGTFQLIVLGWQGTLWSHRKVLTKDILLGCLWGWDMGCMLWLESMAYLSYLLFRADSWFAPSPALLCNEVSHWLRTNLESTLLLLCFMW